MDTQNYYALEVKIESMIDDLQGLCSQNGLSNTAGEELVVTNVFLYKFLNDKYIYNLEKFADEIGETKEELLKNENHELDGLYDSHPTDVVFHEEDTIEYLINRVKQDGFSKKFDDALERISNYEANDKFKVKTSGGEMQPLFSRITETIIDSKKRDAFAAAIFGIISESKFDFKEAFSGNFDFYSAIFEYLIKNYKQSPMYLEN